jgi:hypothetical protein
MNKKQYDLEQKETAEALRKIADWVESGEIVNPLFIGTRVKDMGIFSRCLYSGPISGIVNNVIHLLDHNQDNSKSLQAAFLYSFIVSCENPEETLNIVKLVFPKQYKFAKPIIQNYIDSGELKSHIKYNEKVKTAYEIRQENKDLQDMLRDLKIFF